MFTFDRETFTLALTILGGGLCAWSAFLGWLLWLSTGALPPLWLPFAAIIGSLFMALMESVRIRS